MKKNMKNQKGFSLIELLVVVIIIGIIAAIAIPSLLNSRRSANEAAAIGSMRNFHTANATYLTTQAPNTFAATGAALAAAKMIDSTFGAAVDGTGTKHGYTWDYDIGATDPQLYTLTATGATYQKSYFINESGVIRFANAAADGTPTAATSASAAIP